MLGYQFDYMDRLKSYGILAVEMIQIGSQFLIVVDDSCVVVENCCWWKGGNSNYWLLYNWHQHWNADFDIEIDNGCHLVTKSTVLDLLHHGMWGKTIESRVMDGKF